MNSSYQILISHVIETLPGDIRRRRAVLHSLVCSLPQEVVPEDLRSLLGDLDRHIIAQRELCLGLGVAVVEPAARGSGRLGDTPMESTAPAARPVKGGRR